LSRAEIGFLLGGAHALAPYTGVSRDTKDLDVFLREGDCLRALAALASAGFATELTFPHWLAKAYAGDRFIDLIFSSGNGVARVDDDWFRHAVPSCVLGVPVRLCPPEEMIWSKAFIMERERYDGADVAHLILACRRELDWGRLLARFGRRRRAIPDPVMDLLLERLREERARSETEPRVCDGTLLSRQQYLLDITERGYADGRLAPRGQMTAAAIAHWTAAIPPETGAAWAQEPPLRVVHSNGRPETRARRRRR
jgi:hypothetical protein